MHAWLIATLVVLCVLVAVLTGLLIVLVQNHGRVLLAKAELERRLHALGGEPGPEDLPQGLPIGSDAPSFELPDLEGRVHRLDEYRGEPFVLAFFNPGCGYCQQLSPRLGELAEGSRRLVLVSQGEKEDNLRLQEAHRWRCDVVHEDDWAVVQAYQTYGTPSGYLIDAEGRIASPLVLGADGLLELCDPASTPAPAPGSAEANGRGGGSESHSGGRLRTRDTSESRLVRDGLKAGTIAPTFVLPDLDGTMRSLTEFRGKRLLVVFSAPDCGPCDELAPKLVELFESRPEDLELVMISRGDPDVNRSKAVLNAYSFPVLLQKSWEVSKQYGMFATPIGYLVSETGVVVKDVAVGGDAILSLVSRRR
jgi:peroxiredoxin